MKIKPLKLTEGRIGPAERAHATFLGLRQREILDELEAALEPKAEAHASETQATPTTQKKSKPVRKGSGAHAIDRNLDRAFRDARGHDPRRW